MLALRVGEMGAILMGFEIVGFPEIGVVGWGGVELSPIADNAIVASVLPDFADVFHGIGNIRSLENRPNAILLRSR